MATSTIGLIIHKNSCIYAWTMEQLQLETTKWMAVAAVPSTPTWSSTSPCQCQFFLGKLVFFTFWCTRCKYRYSFWFVLLLRLHYATIKLCLNWILLLAHQNKNNQLVNFVATYLIHQFFWNSNLACVQFCVRNPNKTKLFWTKKFCCQIKGTQLHRNKVSAFNLFNIF